MKETWRWYGRYDTIGLDEIAQTGASGIVTALHEVPYGEFWSPDAIAARRAELRAAGFTWDVVESLPVHERIKRSEGDVSALFANYRQSLANLSAEGIKVVCYNFMPLLDWTRTDLAAPVATGGTCLRFSAVKMAAFELHMLGRDAAASDYSPDVISASTIWFQASTAKDRETLLHAIMSGLPGAFDRYDVDGLKRALQGYDGLGRSELRSNYQRFLEEVVPAADDLGMRLCVHPDDPPRDILALPRIVSNADDIDWILGAIQNPANGLTFCAGSLGANPENDLTALARKHADRIHFVHLRNVSRELDGSFEEAAHLAGDNDMAALIEVLLAEEARRRSSGRPDSNIPFRPDHGHEILSDLARKNIPGYPLIGRMRGLAEIRGVIAGLTHSSRHLD